MTEATLLTPEEYAAATAAGTACIVDYEYCQQRTYDSGLWDECFSELDQALNCTKSKRLQELITSTVERLKVLRNLAEQQEAAIKQLKEANPVQQYIATSDGQYILTAFHGQPMTQEQPNSFATAATNNAYQQQKPPTGATKARGSATTIATQTDHRITGSVFHSTDVMSISKAARPPPKAAKIRSNKLKTDEEPPKEYFVSDAMNYAYYTVSSMHICVLLSWDVLKTRNQFLNE